jgi:D-3-phosphoglycerate dehydrogenase
VPLTSGTRNLIGAEELARMKPGARLVNCARGGLVDESAVAEALDAGRLGGAALDVFETEPPEGSPLIGRADVVATPHLGASTREAQENVAVELAQQVRDYFLTGAIRNAVNMPALSAEAFREAEPYLDLAGRLGVLAGTLEERPIASLAFEYLGEASSLPLPAVTLAGLKGVLSTRAGESVNFVNARVMAAEKGIPVEESYQPDVPDYANLVRVTIRTAEGSLSLSGTLLRKKEPRLVAIGGYELDAVPAGNMIFLRNDDVPGVVGTIGTLLGNAGVNIARINWGRDADRGSAMTVIHVDQEPSAEVLDAMARTSRVRWVKAVTLS